MSTHYNYFAKRGTAIGSWMRATGGMKAGGLVEHLMGLHYVEPSDWKDDGKSIRAHFSSVHEFIECPFRVAGNKRKWDYIMHTANGKWTPAAAGINDKDNWQERSAQDWIGAPNANIAANRVVNGWPEGAEEVFKRMADLDVPVPSSIRRKINRSDQGDELDIHSVYRGDLDHAWTSRRRKHSRSKMTVRIVTRSNQQRGITSDQVFWRGAAVVKLSDMLTEAGYNVEILCAIAARNLDHQDVKFLVTFPLKGASDPLDCEQLAGITCHSGFHRMFGFRGYNALIGWEAGKKAKDDYHQSLHAYASSNAMVEEADLGADGVHVFPIAMDITTKQEAHDWVAKCVAELEAENT